MPDGDGRRDDDSGGIKVVKDELQTARKYVEKLERRRDELQQQALARGTGDVQHQAHAAKQQDERERTRGICARIELALRKQPLPIQDIAHETGDAVGLVARGLRILRSLGKLYAADVGENPVWMLKIESATPDELRDAIGWLLRRRPMTYSEMATATGASETRVVAAVIHVRRQHNTMTRLADGRWFLMPPGARARRTARKR